MNQYEEGGGVKDMVLLTSLGKTPGAMVLTRTLVPMNVVASIRLRCVAAALLEE